ncbi:phosphoribosyltransferase family protein [Microbacterium rhizosphaerae]|uniref:Phosphoribosyltransferase family protein n=1 Tax=Microbacterium rhizosphaerae TaxID=1678237 RepID=A0ABZ0SM46_9MICO|nr:phosphoribosyltransferase family protein [Microbacterium rhizosphaerae]WPR90188.1 phosphoribosyltransferase family protein [Microbacterium rhizosphaerae]
MFKDRSEAGRLLAGRLSALAAERPVVVGLPRGGVPVAFEVASALHAPLDVLVVRKLGVPYQPELALGAIGENGVRVVDEDLVRMAGVSPDELEDVERRERSELERRITRFRDGRRAVPLAGKTVIIVDDGIATGSTARAACRVARALGASRVVLAAPVGPPGAAERLHPDADEVICLFQPADYYAVGQAYRDFSQTPDDEVERLLARASTRSAPSGGTVGATDPEVFVQTRDASLAGSLTVPDDATGIVLFAHGSGSSRFSPRNRYVASVLNGRGIATLLLDLLVPDEEHDRRLVFDIDLLASRLAAATAWVRENDGTAGLRVCYFGASTGAAAALAAAGEQGADITAIVSRGGRPDLAGPMLVQVTAPTLFIVGGADHEVLELNRLAQSRMRCPTRLEIVPGATHLFEEPGALEQVASLAGAWFADHLSIQRSPAAAADRG